MGFQREYEFVRDIINYVNTENRKYWENFFDTNLWLNPYKSGMTPMHYQSRDYQLSRALSWLPIYGALYRAGAEKAKIEDYSKNRDGWNGIVRYPGSTDVGGWSDIGGSMIEFVSDNVRRLYR